MQVSELATEVLYAPTAIAQVAEHCVEILIAAATPSPTTPTGGAVSHHVVEVLSAYPSMVQVSNLCIEVLMSPPEGAAPASASATRAWVSVT